MARVKKRRIIQQTGKRGTSKNAATGQWKDEPDKDGLTRLQRRFNRLAGPVTITYIEGPTGPITEVTKDAD